MVRNADEALNGGLVADATFGFGLSNAGDTLYLLCGGEIIDSIEFGGQSALPRSRKVAYGRSGNALVGRSVAETPWCEATAVYFDGHLGTPGAANPACAR